MVLLMKASNPMKYLPDMMKHLSDLCEIDVKRAAYYRDLQTRYQIENFIVSCDLNRREASLTKKVNSVTIITFKRRLELFGRPFQLTFGVMVKTANLLLY